MLAELDYDALQRLADAATPGVWARSGSRSIESDMNDGSWQIVVDQLNAGVGAGVIEAADAEFIAASRSAVPALLARVRELEAERDAALSTIAKVREAVSGHPKCDQYEDDDTITCGWKNAYASVVRALEDAPEVRS